MTDRPKLKIIPLGGLGEIGKNMMLLEYDEDIMVVDAGIMFPKEEMLGIDLVLPDTSYVVENKEKLKGIVITHGHEDHIGALPFIAADLEAPVYATPLTEGLISVKMKERRGKGKVELRPLRIGREFSLGCFKIEAFPVCHSIPDSAGLIIHTPVGTIIHSGDFKIDHTPVDGKPTDFTRLAQLSQHNILALLSDSTYAELPGYTPSEKIVNEALDNVIGNAHGRVIIATFASLISRFQQVVNAAKKHQRKVFIIGKSMVESSQMSIKMGYLSIPHGILGNLSELPDMPDKKVIILATGSQGEPTSALVRIANGDHRQISIIPGDTVIMSATPIPGNEAL
ncbi:MAG: ribonuclease J, partial [Candidatus Tectomicrobia bacterium]|nr:ribonuclease J [Candidatus Tectomicrobia bacterium]